MAELKVLEYKYSKNYQTVFEDLATLMFCTRIGLSRGVNRRINEKGIESEPVVIGTKKYAYQAKYYKESTKLYEHKKDLIESIEAAAAEGVTDLYLFINKDIPSKVYRTNEEPQYIKDIKKAAADNNLSLHWWTLSKIESTLDMPEYQYIRDIYLGRGESSIEGFSTFYEHICEQFKEDSESELYGDMSLADSYIEPTIKINKNQEMHISNVRSYLEKWVGEEENIAIICGEPGHGKTSLCHKAMSDFYKDGWLAGKVSNVFCFSLNPANTNALSNNAFYFYGLLSWGTDRKNHMISEEDCRNALIFFDGFDELIEWYPKFNISDFIKKYIIPFYKNTNSHIIITSRTMAVDPEKTDYTFRNGMKVAVNKLLPINKDDQLSWIRRYMKRVREFSSKEAEDIENYYRDYQKLIYEQDIEDNSLNSILGIPIIFRMIVTARYHPARGQSITEIFNELFDITWDRHKRQDDEDPTIVKSQLAKHALKIFIDDNYTAETDTLTSSAWLFSFYTTHEGKKRVGFLHRSFYQYFLAYEVLSWHQKYAYNHDTCELRDRLAYLARKKLDKTTISYIKELYLQVEDKEALDESFEKVNYILKETDGILLLPKDRNDAEHVQKVCSLERASNVFWNGISIGSICGKPLQIGKTNNLCLRTYDLSECYLLNAQLEGADLRRSLLVGSALNNITLRGADISDANLSKADLSKAILSGSTFNAANLSGANLSGAELDGAYLVNTDLRDVNLSGANLSGANLSGARLDGANLSNANFNGANLSGAKLDDANLSDVKLIDANLIGAELNSVNLSGANLTRAKLQKIRLSNVKLSGVNLSKTALSEAEFSDVIFIQADLRGADLRGANLKKVDFRLAKLSEANISGGVFISSQLSKADFKRATLVRTVFIDSNISGAEFCDANLSDAAFSGSSLINTKLIGANLSRTYFREVNLSCSELRNANLRNADFRDVYFTGADIIGATISETDFNNTEFNQVNIDLQNEDLLRRQGYDTSVMNTSEYASVELLSKE